MIRRFLRRVRGGGEARGRVEGCVLVKNGRIEF
jgi:hypothetical protein